MTDWLLPFLCGLGAAVISAWGVGGGTLLLLVMTLFLGVDQRTAQGINLLFFLPTAISALLCHWREGYLDVPTWKAAVPVAVPAALAGAWIATAVDVDLLRRPFGIDPVSYTHLLREVGEIEDLVHQLPMIRIQPYRVQRVFDDLEHILAPDDRACVSFKL